MSAVVERRQLRRGLSAAWAAINPILLDGEEGFETDTERRKVGDGITSYLGLAYAPDGSEVFTLLYRERVSIFSVLTGAEQTDVLTRAKTVDLTQKINSFITANPGCELVFPQGDYVWSDGGYLTDGQVITGAGRNATRFFAGIATGTMVYVGGYGAGIRGVRFDSNVPQTGGAYVRLAAPETFIADFYMNNDFLGVHMLGNVSQIRNGRFQDAAAGGTRIYAEGGDNSQTIQNVLVGAQSPANIAYAGIKVDNCTALTIDNVSVLQQNRGLMICPSSNTRPVLDLIVSNSNFDNCINPIEIAPTGTGACRRLKFDTCWASSGNDGVLMTGPAGSISGVSFIRLQANANNGSGVAIGTGVSDVSFIGGNLSQNAYGMYCSAGVVGLSVQDMRIGASSDFTGNAGFGIFLDGTVTPFDYVSITNNIFRGNGTAVAYGGSLGAHSVIRDNLGHNPIGGSTITVSASPFTYQAAQGPETIYISGGTVSSIVVAGATAFTSTEKTIHLEPNEFVTVTYSSIPSMKKAVH